MKAFSLVKYAPVGDKDFLLVLLPKTKDSAMQILGQCLTFNLTLFQARK
jgi:hypothetical protein